MLGTKLAPSPIKDAVQYTEYLNQLYKQLVGIIAICAVSVVGNVGQADYISAFLLYSPQVILLNGNNVCTRLMPHHTPLLISHGHGHVFSHYDHLSANTHICSHIIFPKGNFTGRVSDVCFMVRKNET